MHLSWPRIGSVGGLLIACLLAACGAWEVEAPVSWQPKPCPTLAAQLAGLSDHVAAGGLTATHALLSQPAVGADLRVFLRFAQETAATPAGPASDATSDATEDAAPKVGAIDPATVTAWLEVLVGELTKPPPGQATAAPALTAIAAIGACGTPDAWQLIGALLRDKRASAGLHSLARASLRSAAIKNAELAAVGLDAPENFLVLTNTLLRSLADPTFDPTTLLALLGDLAAAPDGLLAALGGGVALLVTDETGAIAPQRRAQTAALLTCARAPDTVGALPWLLHGLMVRQPGLDAPLPPAQDWRGALDISASTADALAQAAVVRDALARLLVGALTTPILGELRTLLRPPLAAELGGLVTGIAEAATCTQR
mgnify:CR=1 FL=1